MTIGLSVPAATYLPLYVAVDEGTFAKQGIQADLVEFRGGADLIKALAQRTGLSEQDLTAQLSQVLPGVVDKLTPAGRLPTMAELSETH